MLGICLAAGHIITVHEVDAESPQQQAGEELSGEFVLGDIDRTAGNHCRYRQNVGIAADLIGRVEDAFRADPLMHQSHSIMAVFELLSRKISAGEIEDVQHALPEDVRDLWPEPYVAAGAGR